MNDYVVMVELYQQRKNEEPGGGDWTKASLSTTNPTWTDLGLNPGLIGWQVKVNVKFTL